jgi:cytochrome c5
MYFGDAWEHHTEAVENWMMNEGKNDAKNAKYWGDSCRMCHSDVWHHLPTEGHWSYFRAKGYAPDGV